MRIRPAASRSCTPGSPHPHSPVCPWVPPGHHPPARCQGQGQGHGQAPREAKAAPTPWWDAAAAAPSGGVERGEWTLGPLTFWPLMPGSPGNPASPCEHPMRSHTSTCTALSSQGTPPIWNGGGLSPLYSLVALVLVHPGAPRWNPAAVQRGHGHRRTGRSPPARAGRGQGSGGAWGCTPSKQVGQRDRHSPSPLSSLGCQHLPGEEKEEQGWVLLGQAGCHSVSPQL